MLFVADGKLRTFFGWSPGLRITLGARALPCGCLVGSYETWEGDASTSSMHTTTVAPRQPTWTTRSSSTRTLLTRRNQNSNPSNRGQDLEFCYRSSLSTFQ